MRETTVSVTCDDCGQPIPAEEVADPGRQLYFFMRVVLPSASSYDRRRERMVMGPSGAIEVDLCSDCAVRVFPGVVKGLTDT